MPYRLVQENSVRSTHTGQYKAESVYWGTHDLADIADELSKHTSLYSKAEIMGVIYKMQQCLLELTAMGYKVEIGDLGYFYMSIHNAQGGVDARTDAPKIDKVSFNFLPHQTVRVNYNKTSVANSLEYVDIATIPGLSDYYADDDDDDAHKAEPAEPDDDTDDEPEQGGGTDDGTEQGGGTV